MMESKAAVESLITEMRRAIDTESGLIGKMKQSFFDKLFFGDKYEDTLPLFSAR